MSHLTDPARSFDLAAKEYERTRPDYPAAVLEKVPVPAGATVLDLGAGSGKLTRLLVRRYARVIAVEPLDGMRAILAKVVPQAESLAGRAEEIPLPDASVDAVFAAQAFHWFATDEALTEITRVLRGGGVFCLVWNAPDESRPWPLPQPYTDYLEELHAERSTGDGPPFGEVIGRGPFGEIHEFAVAHDHALDRQGLLDNARSVSWIASRSSDDHRRVMRRLGRLLPQGTYSIPNLANVMWAVRS
jgi:SAM-dependent methyltransferase